MAARSPRKVRDRTQQNIEKIKEQREARREQMEAEKAARAASRAQMEAAGTPGDVDFQRLVHDWRVGRGAEEEAHIPPGNVRINIVARKRPIGRKEVSRQEYDVVTCLNPTVVVHYPKTKVDGITKYLENQTFEFDHTFHEGCSTDMVYEYSVLPLVAHIFTPGGRATCFAYGQTGSGKTYTMSGVQLNAARDIFRLMRSPEHADKDLSIYTAFFEIYGGRCFDVLHGRSKVVIREDGRGNVQAVGLRHVPCASEEELLAIIEEGNASRTTKKTHMNDASSRSHAVCEILVKDGRGRVFGKMSLIDLAGSERAADARHHDRQRRVESAGINKSLLALKECIRALGSSASHVPFRASKLTMVLKDSFTARQARVAMIATVSPSSTSADHTTNTLRYADRVKEKKVGGKGAPKKPGAFGIGGPAAVDIQYLQRPVAGGQVDWSGKGSTPAPAPAPAAGRGETGLPPSSYGRADPARGGRPSTQSHASAEDASEGKSAGGEGRRGSGASGAPRRSRGGRGGGRAAAPRPEWVDVTDTTPEEGSPSAPSSPAAAAAGGEGGPESPSRADLEQLARTMRAEAAEDGLAFDDGEFVNINLCLDRVVEQEEALLASHMSSIQRHAEFLTEEGGLLSKCSGPDVVDYDIDAYTASLESILQNKLKDTKALLKQLQGFRTLLRMEEKLTMRRGEGKTDG